MPDHCTAGCNFARKRDRVPEESLGGSPVRDVDHVDADDQVQALRLQTIHVLLR